MIWVIQYNFNPYIILNYQINVGKKEVREINKENFS